MNANEYVLSWLLWHQAVKYLQHDIPLVEEAAIRFPRQYGGMLRLIGKEAHNKEQEAARELRRNGIRILGEKLEHGELFLMWQQKGETEMLRVLESKVRFEVQKKLNELMQKFADDRREQEYSRPPLHTL